MSFKILRSPEILYKRLLDLCTMHYCLTIMKENPIDDRDSYFLEIAYISSISNENGRYMCEIMAIGNFDDIVQLKSRFDKEIAVLCETTMNAVKRIRENVNNE